MEWRRLRGAALGAVFALLFMAIHLRLDVALVLLVLCCVVGVVEQRVFARQRRPEETSSAVSDPPQPPSDSEIHDLATQIVKSDQSQSE